MGALAKLVLAVLIVLCIAIFLGLIIIRRFKRRKRRTPEKKSDTENTVVCKSVLKALTDLLE